MTYRTKALDELTMVNYLVDTLSSMSVDLDRKFGTGAKVILKEASESMGAHVLGLYTSAWKVDKWTPELLGRAIVDLKAKLGGRAELVNATNEKVVLKATMCEFGDDWIRESGGLACVICAGVAGAMVKASGLSSTNEVPVWETSIADGSPNCTVVAKLRAN